MAYAGGLLRLVLDHKLMEKAVREQLNSLDYLSIAPGSCFDLFGVNFASVLIVNNSWNEQSVSKISYSFAEIPTLH